MTPGEKEGWQILLVNKLNPAHWRFVGQDRQTPHPSPEIVCYTFQNKETHDFIVLEHSNRSTNKKSRVLYETPAH